MTKIYVTLPTLIVGEVYIHDAKVFLWQTQSTDGVGMEHTVIIGCPEGRGLFATLRDRSFSFSRIFFRLFTN